MACPGEEPRLGGASGPGAIFAFFGKLAELTGGTFRAKLLDVLSSEGRAAALARATGTRPGRDYSGAYLLLFRIEEGRIAEARLFNEEQYAFDRFWA